MPDYRIYKLHPYSGHITDVEEMHAADEASAIHALRQRRFDVAVELWDGGRQVAHLDAPSPDAGFLPPSIDIAPGQEPPPPEPRRDAGKTHGERRRTA